MQENRVGYVYAGAHFAGALKEFIVQGGYEYVFQYAPEYLTSGLAQIGVNLPLTVTPFESRALPTFFSNLVSEGWVKRHQAKLARLDQDDKFGLLLGHGEELIGPIRILTEMLPEHQAEPENQLIPAKSLKGFQIDFPREEFNEVAIASLGRASISGVQPKMFLTHKAGAKKMLTNAMGIGPYIVKPSPNEFPELAINEYIIMQLCDKVGFNVADHYLVPFSCGEMAYVTSRFDIDRTGRHIGFIEDMASAMDVSPGNKSSEALSYERMLKTAYVCCGRHMQVLKDGFLHVLMAYIVGNNDLHLKNMSLIRPMHDSAATGFTKMYDMVSVAPYKEYDASGELSIWLLQSEVDDAFSTSSYEQYGYYTGHDFMQLANQLSLGEKVGQVLMDKLVTKIYKCIEKVLADSPGTEQLKDVIRTRIQNRINTLYRKKLS
ncbi:HipA domain-containing protein [Rheinheimera sp. KL1]|uniref:type II toxin-antitoxin system HipA family toxin n=1 Tax=Rheinheimera sp. KL1 TaxID=1635005 RepID=UPI0006A9FE97|nr:HipA domain-containing protein [Rheinheimera sp. KL1]